MTDPYQVDVPPAGEHATISGTDVPTGVSRVKDRHVVEVFQASQREQMQMMSDKFEASFDRLTNLLRTVFQASGEGKRKADTASAGSSASKSPRLSHIGSAEEKGASTFVIGRDLSDSFSSNNDDNISIPDANSLDHDIADLLADQQQIEISQPKETSEEILASREAEWSLIEDKGADINIKLAKITNNLFSDKMQEDKIKEKLKKHPIPNNCNNLTVEDFFEEPCPLQTCSTHFTKFEATANEHDIQTLLQKHVIVECQREPGDFTREKNLFGISYLHKREERWFSAHDSQPYETEQFCILQPFQNGIP